jgi:ribulose kinase
LENPEEFIPSDIVVEWLARKHLRLLKKKSAKFPRARWFCDLCEYHCDNLTKAAAQNKSRTAS